VSRNIEIKARADDLDAVRTRAVAIAEGNLVPDAYIDLLEDRRSR
jgi:hypothetical protein